MTTYFIAYRSEPYGKFGFAIKDARGTKIAGVRGCATLERAEKLARAALERTIRADALMGRRSHCANPPVFERAYAWRDLDGRWYVGDADSAGTHQPPVSREAAMYEAERANERAAEEAPEYWGGTDE